MDDPPRFPVLPCVPAAAPGEAVVPGAGPARDVPVASRMRQALPGIPGGTGVLTGLAGRDATGACMRRIVAS
ncbi:hypothetical protein SXCC_04390 [Gluconacetobacter sp. SXCC-1]|uniref:hypothetical protein n=1 Tax=Komagataeibacter rhaeticus TaxID=215221 RepID=UPI0002080238|nr:hypothetical protein [Komagataeibacter rhaeticus]EGG75019.1 hypothetical protein SXCC_04390 [Gluconacetobacter sp. SXCC-1]QOC45466.1 hypothetical protein ICJ78_09760 [Komagataeibacter rhaeticus]